MEPLFLKERLKALVAGDTRNDETDTTLHKFFIHPELFVGDDDAFFAEPSYGADLTSRFHKVKPFIFTGSTRMLMGKSIQDARPRQALKAQVGFPDDLVLKELIAMALGDDLAGREHVIS
jgi:hypothetical protein